jgi:hypothetical protein
MFSADAHAGDDFKLEKYSAFRVATLTLGGLDLGSV